MPPPVNERDGPVTRDPYDALRPEAPRRSAIAAILPGALGLVLWSILGGAPAGAGAPAVAG